MLASLLPGLRELRAPLAAGYLWLVAGWLAFANGIPRPTEASGLLGDIYYLAGAVGVPATTAAATFAAYLVGVLSLMATASAVPMIGGLRRRRAPFGRLKSKVAVPTAAGRYALHDAVLYQLEQRLEQDSDLERRLGQARDECGGTRPLTDPHARRALLAVWVDVDSYVTEVAEEDLAQLPLRLLGDEVEREVYGEFDRLRAESEFRAAVVLPLAAIVAILAWRATPWAALAMVVPVLILIDATHTASAAADVLAEAVRARKLETRVLTEVRDLPVRTRTDWLDRAAERGYPGAMAQRARTLKAKGDLTGYEEWLRKAAEAGNRDAVFDLAGLLYLRDDSEAETWYVNASTARHPDMQEIKKLSKEPGLDVDDLKRAYAGDPVAMTKVGHWYGAHGSFHEAEWWFNRGCKEAGHQPACAALTDSRRSRGMDETADEWRRTVS